MTRPLLPEALLVAGTMPATRPPSGGGVGSAVVQASEARTVTAPIRSAARHPRA